MSGSITNPFKHVQRLAFITTACLVLCGCGAGPFQKGISLFADNGGGVTSPAALFNDDKAWLCVSRGLYPGGTTPLELQFIGDARRRFDNLDSEAYYYVAPAHVENFGIAISDMFSIEKIHVQAIAVRFAPLHISACVPPWEKIDIRREGDSVHVKFLNWEEQQKAANTAR